ncbi:MAG: hypothetical protein ACLQVL_28240 [Terriglobia bacterium]
MINLQLEFKPLINTLVLTSYRLFAIVTLYAVLAGVLIYGFGAGFYAISTTWVAPIIFSPQDKDTLDLTGKLLVTATTVEDLKLDIDKLQQTVAEAQTHKAALEKLRPALDEAIARECKFRQETGPELVHLTGQKESDNVRTAQVLEESRAIEASIHKELTAGLITKTDAIEAETDLAKSSSDFTDSRIGAVLLQDNIIDKTTTTTTYLDTLDKRAELESEIATLGITVATAQSQIATEKSQIQKFDQALDIAKTTPYWAAIDGGNISLVFVPYDNQAAAVEDTPVYDCYLSFIACRQVGRLKRTFVGEQQATHPIFRTELRGFLAQVELSVPDSAKSKTLFLGAKPILF